MKKSKRPFKRWEKTIKNDRDWDFTYMYLLEYRKIIHMLKYWEDYTKATNIAYKSSDEKCCSVLRDLRLCKKLLEIMIDEDGKVWDVTSPGFHTEKIPGKELWELKSNDPDSPGICKELRYFNIKNCYRFHSGPQWKSYQEWTERMEKKFGFPNHIVCNLINDMRVQKARHLYHLIRFYREETWWE